MSLFPYFVNDTILQNAFSKKFEEQAREGKLVKFAYPLESGHPPQMYTDLFHRYLSSIAQTNVSKSSSVRNSVRNSPRFIASMSSVCKTEHSLHTLYSTDRSLRPSSARNLELKSFEKVEKRRRRKKKILKKM